jgi:hypothetical protein
MIKAKPVIQDQYWILRDQDGKVGNIQADNTGYSVRINNTETHVDSLDSIRNRFGVDFEMIVSRSNSDIGDNQVYGYPTTSIPHNVVWDVRRQIPIWTKDNNSRSYFAAGWFRIRQGSSWKLTMCPKVIILDRYQYQGPFRNRQEAMQP